MLEHVQEKLDSVDSDVSESTQPNECKACTTCGGTCNVPPPNITPVNRWDFSEEQPKKFE